jgi:predicted nucleic acid-binding protein
LSSFVIDASIALSWCFEDEASSGVEHLLDALVDSRATAPSIWPLEISNALVMSERKGRLTNEATLNALAKLARLGVSIDTTTHERAMNEIMRLAKAERLTAYDAAYLELAIRRALPLATLDSELISAAMRLGVPLLGA